jgi:hypothetical protein
MEYLISYEVIDMLLLHFFILLDTTAHYIFLLLRVKDSIASFSKPSFMHTTAAIMSECCSGRVIFVDIKGFLKSLFCQSLIV